MWSLHARQINQCPPAVRTVSPTPGQCSARWGPIAAPDGGPARARRLCATTANWVRGAGMGSAEDVQQRAGGDGLHVAAAHRYRCRRPPAACRLLPQVKGVWLRGHGEDHLWRQSARLCMRSSAMSLGQGQRQPTCSCPASCRPAGSPTPAVCLSAELPGWLWRVAGGPWPRPRRGAAQPAPAEPAAGRGRGSSRQRRAAPGAAAAGQIGAARTGDGYRQGRRLGSDEHHWGGVWVEPEQPGGEFSAPWVSVPAPSACPPTCLPVCLPVSLPAGCHWQCVGATQTRNSAACPFPE